MVMSAAGWLRLVCIAAVGLAIVLVSARATYGQGEAGDGGQKLVLPKEGDRVRVILRDGTRMEGAFVREDESFVVIMVAGVEAPIDARTVVDVEVVGDEFEQYVRLRGAIRDDDVPRLISLVNWLAQREMHEEALSELDGIQKHQPNNAEAKALRTTIAQLKALRDKRVKRAAGPGNGAVPEGGPEPRRLTAEEFGLLTPEQINLIKVYEIDLNQPPAVVVKRETVDRLLQKYAEHPLVPVTREGREALHRKPAIEIVSLLFQVGARDLYGEVQVVGQPASMAMFRDVVHAGWLVNRCGTTQCHGGADAGKLMLTNRRPRSDEAVYTNFLILDRFRTSLGAPMIDYESPERSALLQMGLPRADALYQHPPAQGWRPIFRSRDDPGYVRGMEWIRTMYRPHPEYPIDYTPPGRRGGDPRALEGPLDRGAPKAAEPSGPTGER